MNIPKHLKPHVHPWRHRPKSVSKPSTRGLKPAQRRIEEDMSDPAWFERAVARLPEALQSAGQEAVWLLSGFTEERIAAASTDGLAFFEALSVANGKSVASVFAALRTPADAVAIAWGAKALLWDRDFRSVFHPVSGVEEVDAWKAVRAAVAVAKDAPYAEALARAEALFSEEAPPRRRQWLAYVFPDQPWGDALLAAHEDKVLYGATLATRTVALLTEAVDRTGPPDRLPLLATAAVGMEPADAVAWLSDVLSTNVGDGSWYDATEVVRTLSLFPSDDVEAALAPHRHHAQINEAIELYFD